MAQTTSISPSETTVRPYILAGGLSSRMGTDKAMRELAGRTLLGRTVDTLRAVPALADADGKVMVTIVGQRNYLEGADRIIPDKYPQCGPLGGMEAALRDLNAPDEPEWGLFLPVDMPFLPSALIDHLIREWMEAGNHGARVCWVEVDGQVQPLISMVHRSLLPFIVRALTAGCFKVTPVLQSAAEVLAPPSAGGIALQHNVVHRTFVEQDKFTSTVAGWNATGQQQQLKRLWFSNLNSDKEFRDAETFLSRSCYNKHPISISADAN